MFIQTEDTPNPETLKFIPGNNILKTGTADFSSKEFATCSPLASRLFEIDGVSRVFLATDFISVTKDPQLAWNNLKPLILTAIMEQVKQHGFIAAFGQHSGVAHKSLGMYELPRFAQEGNALFGQWTWKNNDGIKPKGNLDANFSVKNFKSLMDSVNSYILNLNTHQAYKGLRSFRSSQYNMDKNITGNDMANFLDKYAEIGVDYVIKVKKMIEINKLSKYENSILTKF